MSPVGFVEMDFVKYQWFVIDRWKCSVKKAKKGGTNGALFVPGGQ
jgi:hypothetical protein